MVLKRELSWFLKYVFCTTEIILVNLIKTSVGQTQAVHDSVRLRSCMKYPISLYVVPRWSLNKQQEQPLFRGWSLPLLLNKVINPYVSALSVSQCSLLQAWHLISGQRHLVPNLQQEENCDSSHLLLDPAHNFTFRCSILKAGLRVGGKQHSGLITLLSHT